LFVLIFEEFNFQMQTCKAFLIELAKGAVGSGSGGAP